MNKDRLFKFLGQQESSVLLTLLSEAYEFLDHDDRNELFGEYVEKAPLSAVDGNDLLVEIEQFVESSREGHYYAPFNINSRNYMNVPSETKQWFEEMGDYLQNSCQLTAQKDYEDAVACFAPLYDLLALLWDGEEIVFGDEIGSWMLPGDEKQHNAAYLTALAATAGPEAFAEIVVPLAQQDSWQNFFGQVYETAVRVADDAQKERLDAEIQRLNIRTKPK